MTESRERRPRVPTPASGDPEDRDLVRRAQEGDDAAFEALCRRYLPELRRRAQGLAHDPDLAAECVQRTLIRFHRGLRSFDADRALKPWLLTILVNTLRSLWTQARRVLTHEDPGGTDGIAAASLGSWEYDPQLQVEHAEQRHETRQVIRHLEECVSELDSDSQRLYRLLYVDQLNHRDAAEVMGISHDNCRQRSVRMRRSLKMCVEGKSRRDPS